MSVSPRETEGGVLNKEQILIDSVLFYKVDQYFHIVIKGFKYFLKR